MEIRPESRPQGCAKPAGKCNWLQASEGDYDTIGERWRLVAV
jgi:hypothetical protein